MINTNNFAEGSLHYYKTKLLGPTHRIVVSTLSVTDGVATLACGCLRGLSLPSTGLSVDGQKERP